MSNPKSPPPLLLSDLLPGYGEDIRTGKPPPSFVMAPPFQSFFLAPKAVTVLGGMPGAGKTAAILQISIDLLRNNPDARLLMANVEMTPQRIIDRITARLSGVSLTSIKNRNMTADEKENALLALQSLESVRDRLCFMPPPYTLENVASAGDQFGANVIILDYLQRFSMRSSAKDRREQVNDVMSMLRHFCDSGAALLCAAAVSRQKGNTGSNYKELNLASFRDSGEIEFGADACYLAVPQDNEQVLFSCPKNRDDEPVPIHVRYDKRIQNFECVEAGPVTGGFAAFDQAIPAPPQRGQRP